MRNQNERKDQKDSLEKRVTATSDGAARQAAEANPSAKMPERFGRGAAEEQKCEEATTPAERFEHGSDNPKSDEAPKTKGVTKPRRFGRGPKS